MPDGLVAEVPVGPPDERFGSVLLLDAEGGPAAGEMLRLAALVALTAATLEDGEPGPQRRASAALLEEIRRTPDGHAGEALSRAQRLGCDLSAGAAAICVQPAAGDRERVLALVAEEFPTALAAIRDDRVEALLPARPSRLGGDPDAAAKRLASRLSRRAPTGLAPREHEPGGLPRALRAAELTMTLAELEGVELDHLLSGSWQLLVQVASGDPGRLDALVESILGPLAAGDRPAHVALVDTLRAYLDHGANMNATAAAIYAHRHTVAYRLEQLAEMTGHDPRTPRGQAQLALALQALTVRDALAAQLGE